MVTTLPPDAAVATTPMAISALPDSLRSHYHAACAGALHPVFLAAAGLAVVIFVLAWAMQKILLRETAGTALTAPDRGYSFVMPRNATSLDELRAASSLIPQSRLTGPKRCEVFRRPRHESGT